jgi:hypothetical protein
MDESFCETTKISALVGLLVPVHEYVDLRAKFYAILRPFFQPEPDVIADAPEVHGVDLPGKTDVEKLRVVSDIVDLVVSSDIEVYRIGYYITKTIRQTFALDQEMLGTCWLSLQFMIQPRLAEGMIIPVMDGFNKRRIQQFSAPIKFCDVMRSAGHGGSLSVGNSQNILGEVFYADSRYSAFVQVVDVVAYLRKITDLQSDGHELPSFKQELRPLAEKIEPSIRSEEIIAFRLDDEIQGPEHRAKKPSGNKGPLTDAFRIAPSDS